MTQPYTSPKGPTGAETCGAIMKVLVTLGTLGTHTPACQIRFGGPIYPVVLIVTEISGAKFIFGIAKTLDTVEDSITVGQAGPRLPDAVVLVMMASFDGRDLFQDGPIPVASKGPGTAELAGEFSITAGGYGQDLVQRGNSLHIMAPAVIDIRHPVKIAPGKGGGVDLGAGALVQWRGGREDVRGTIGPVILTCVTADAACDQQGRIGDTAIGDPEVVLGVVHGVTVDAGAGHTAWGRGRPPEEEEEATQGDPIGQT